MREAIGVVVFIIGVLLGIYGFVVVGLVGGIVDIIEGAEQVPADSYRVAIGVAKFLLSELIGFAYAVIPCIVGFVIVSDK